MPPTSGGVRLGDLAADTAVEGSDGTYRAALSPEWELWGPCGGYVAAIALRAAAAEATLPRPASFSCHYLAVGEFEPVDLEVVTVQRGRRAESFRVSMTQDGRPILEALVRFVAAGDGLSHDVAEHAPVPEPESLKSWDDLDLGPPYTFWSNVEAKPIDYIGDWRLRPAGAPTFRQWYRFRPRPTFDDPTLDAARLLILLDIVPWPAATNASTGWPDYIAPSLDLAVRFHRFDLESEWILAEGESPIAQDGLVSGSARVWSRDGRLLASGEQHMLCRPNPYKPRD